MGEGDKVSCGKCGFSDFEYDRSWKEYACEKCGWIVTDPPTISVLDETRLSRIKKKKPSSIPKPVEVDIEVGKAEVPSYQPGKIDQAKATFILRDDDLLTHGKELRFVAISPEGTTILSFDMEGGMKVWDRSERKLLSEAKGFPPSFMCLAIRPDKRVLLFGLWGDQPDKIGPIEMFDLASGNKMATITKHRKPVYSIAFSPDGKLVASTGLDWAVNVWELATGKLLLRGSHPDWGRDVIFTPDGGRVVSVSQDWTLKVWNLETQSCIATWEGEPPSSYEAVLSKDGNWAAVRNTEENEVSVINVTTGKSIATWHSEEQLDALYAASNGSLIVWQGLKGWHVQGQQYGPVLEAPPGITVFHELIAISRDGSCIVAGGMDEDGSLVIWEAT